MTMRGMILGTAAYMSPEQARGRAVDQRADIWALGAILFEMLSGKPAFAGETVTDVLARVMERDPDWSALPASTPVNVMRVLRRCLEKDPARRLRHVADARLELDDTREPQVVSSVPVSSTWSRVVPWGLAGVLGLAAVAAVATRPSESVALRAPMHFDIVDPPGVRARQTNARSFALSPDGTRLAFVGVREGIRYVFVRDVKNPELQEIYVRAYPALDRAWQVSVGGGVQARWGAGGRELFYRTGNPMVAVAFDGRGTAPVLGKPQMLFDQAFDYGQGISIANYDVLPDGRFVMLRPEPTGAPFHVIRHWADGLKGK